MTWSNLNVKEFFVSFAATSSATANGKSLLIETWIEFIIKNLFVDFFHEWFLFRSRKRIFTHLGDEDDSTLFWRSLVFKCFYYLFLWKSFRREKPKIRVNRSERDKKPQVYWLNENLFASFSSWFEKKSFRKFSKPKILSGLIRFAWCLGMNFDVSNWKKMSIINVSEVINESKTNYNCFQFFYLGVIITWK